MALFQTLQYFFLVEIACFVFALFLYYFVWSLLPESCLHFSFLLLVYVVTPILVFLEAVILVIFSIVPLLEVLKTFILEGRANLHVE